MIGLPIFLFIATWIFWRLAWKYSRNGFSNAVLGFSVFTVAFFTTVASLAATFHSINPGIYGTFGAALVGGFKVYFIDPSIYVQLLKLIPATIITGLIFFIQSIRFKRKVDSKEEKSKHLVDQFPR